MEADTGSGNSGADSGTAADSQGSGSWLGNVADSASNFLHDHGPYAWLNPDQQETAQNVVGGLIDGNRPAAPAPTPAVQTPDTAAPANTGAPAPSAPAPKPAPSNDQLGYAALVCGYTAKDAPRQIDNFGLAQHFGISPNIIAARPDDFYRRWVIKSTRELLPSTPATCRAILNDPHNAAQITPHLLGLANLNAALNGAPPPGAQGGDQNVSYLAELRSRAGDVLGGLYDAVGNTAHTIRNEVVGELHAAVRAGGFLPAQTARALDWVTGSDSAEKWVLRQGNQAEKWLPEEDPNYRPVGSNAFYAASSGVGNGFTYGLRGATVLTGAVPVGIDWAASKLTGNDHDEAENWWFSHTTDNVQAQQERLALDPKASSPEKVLHAAGTMIGMAPFVLPTRGAGIVHNATVVAPLAAINGVNAGNDTFAQTGDADAARKVAAVSALTTELSGTTLMSLFGSRWFAAANVPARAATVTGATLATGEGSRVANNAVAPQGMQQDFSPENTVASLLTMVPAAHIRASAHDVPSGKEPATPNPPSSTEPHLAPPVSEADAPPNIKPPTGQDHIEQAHADLKRATHAFDAAQFASQLNRIAQAARTDTLGKANPALKNNLVREMDAETGSPAIYAKQDEVLRALQQAGIAPESLKTALPELYAQLQGQPADGMVRFSRADLAQHPDLLEPLVPIARASKDAPNAIEASATAQDHFEGVRQKAQASARNATEQKDSNDEPPEYRSDRRLDDYDRNVRHPLFDKEQWAKYQEELRSMSPEDRAIAERFADKLRNYDAAVAEYVQLKDSQGGKVLNTDLARELSEDYLNDRTKSEVVQRLSSALVRKMYADKLAATKEPMVLFSAGGPGAGKTTVLNDLPALAKTSSSTDIIYDTTMSHYDSAKGMIEQALQANGSVDLVLVIREPTDALLNGVIRRAVEEEKLYGSGRTVTLDYFLSAQPAAIRNVFRLAEEYKGDADVQFRFVDNTHGEDDIREVSLEQAKQIEFQQVEERAREILEQEYRDGRISKKTYTGIKFGKDVP